MEEWKNIRGNPNYIVSNTGRVRRKGNNKDHSMRDTKGYLTTDLYRNGKRKKARDKHNNNASNLEWVTKKENCRHAWDNGLVRPSYGMQGKKNPKAGRHGRPFMIVETGEIFKTLEE